MGMRADIGTVPGVEHDRSEVIQEYKRTDHAALHGRQRSTNLEAIAEIPDGWNDHMFDRHFRRFDRDIHMHLTASMISSGLGKRLLGSGQRCFAGFGTKAELFCADESDVGQTDEAEQSF